MTRSELIHLYYDVSELLGDDVDCVSDAIIHLTGTSKTRYNVKLMLEHLRLNHLEEELNYLYDLKVSDLKEFSKVWELNEKPMGYQFTIWDYL